MANLENILTEYGANYDEVMARFVDDEELYIESLIELCSYTTYEELYVDIDDKKFEDAFEKAHSLKGILANMGLTSFYMVMSEITEKLRTGETSEFNGLIEQLKIEKLKVDSVAQKCSTLNVSI